MLPIFINITTTIIIATDVNGACSIIFILILKITDFDTFKDK